MKEATARRLTLAGLVACALIACAAAESDTRLGSSNLARIDEIDDQVGVLCAGDEVGPGSDRAIEPHLHRVLVPLPIARRADRVQAAP